MKNVEKYERGYYMPPVKCMKWAEKEYVDHAPAWCSVDLRDGNQALIIPMSLEEKLEFFTKLVEIGFKEIEIGFPAASETEYEFCRTLIEKNMIPDDVTIHVLTQAREHIIRKTFAALEGAPQAVVHLYNSTSVAQREQVFKKSKEEIKQLAVDGAKLLIAADCTAYAYANMHQEFMKGKITIIGCPKLDDVDYSEKLTQIISNNNIQSVTIVRMEVPCCGGLEMAAKKALQNSGKFIPWQVVTISIDGKIME